MTWFTTTNTSTKSYVRWKKVQSEEIAKAADSSNCPCIKPIVGCLLAIVVLIVVGVVIFIIVSRYTVPGKPLKVLALNTWGMPHEFSKDKEVRMTAIGEFIGKGEYDVYLLEELWMRPNHATINSLLPKGEDFEVECPEYVGEGTVRWIKNVGDFVLTGEAVCLVEGSANVSVTSPKDGVLKRKFVKEGDVVTPYTPLFILSVGGYYMTAVGNLANSACDGRVLTTSCSGLAVVSRFPFKQIFFKMYNWRGNEFKIPPDGEWYAGKGIGRVRIEPHLNFSVDIFVTQTIALDDNWWYRQKQVEEMVTHVEVSDADFVIVGGDFNVDPRTNETSYHSLKKVMVSCIDEYFHIINDWLDPFGGDPSRATFGNAANTYSYKYEPVMYDYIFHKAKGWNFIWTEFFQVPLLKKWIGGDVSSGEKSNKNISFSDHEAVASHLRLFKYQL